MSRKIFQLMSRLVLLAIFLLPILAAGCGGDGQALNPDWPNPTVQPSDDPTAEPTVEPTEEPTVGPTEEPTGEVVLKELEIPQELASPTVVLGNQLQLAVNGIYSDGTTKDLTTEVAWSSEDSSIASVEEATGLVSALALGVTTVTATDSTGKISTSVPVTVVDYTSLKLEVWKKAGVSVEEMGKASASVTFILDDGSESSQTDLPCTLEAQNDSETAQATIDISGLGLCISKVKSVTAYCKDGDTQYAIDWFDVDEGVEIKPSEDSVLVSPYEHPFAGGEGTEASPYLVANPAQLAAIGEEAYKSGKYFQQTKDIDFANSCGLKAEWTEEEQETEEGQVVMPIKLMNFTDLNSNLARYYGEQNTDGTGRGWTPVNVDSLSYDGNGFTIDNLMVNYFGAECTAIGLFGSVGDESNTSNDSPVVFKNMNLASGCFLKSDYDDESLEDVMSAGGLCGKCVCGAGGLTVDSCSSAVNVYFGQKIGFAGGLIGCSLSPSGASIDCSGCSNTGTVAAKWLKDDSYGESGLGGLFGGFGSVVDESGDAAQERCSWQISKCSNAGPISGAYMAAGIIGCQTDAPYAAYADLALENCSNTGDLYAAKNSGGILNTVSLYDWDEVDINCHINNCYNTGTIWGMKSDAGGIVGTGYALDKCDFTVNSCYNTGNVTGEYVGGIIGDLDVTRDDEPGEKLLSNCFNTGTITDENDSPGGLIGFLRCSKFAISNCCNYGDSEYAAIVEYSQCELTLDKVYYDENKSDCDIGFNDGTISGECVPLTTEQLKGGSIDGSTLVELLGSEWVQNSQEDEALGAGILKGYAVLKWMVTE